MSFKRAAFGLQPQEIEEKTSLRAFVGNIDVIRPSHVSQVLDQISSNAIFILDEFDRVGDEEAKTQMADLIKSVSDNNGNITIVLVGVAESIAELIGEHPSVQRNLVQIELPPMDADEIKTILENGCRLLGLTVPDSVLDEVAFFANGFPHYAHLLGLSIARACEIRETDTITKNMFDTLACNLAVEDAIETYRSAFSRATRTSKASRYPAILCACAHAQCDEQGVFRATDVADAMKTVFVDPVSIQTVVPALGEFCNDHRGNVLRQVAVGDRSHYCFSDQMMRPFLRIKARNIIQAGEPIRI